MNYKDMGRERASKRSWFLPGSVGLQDPRRWEQNLPPAGEVGCIIRFAMFCSAGGTHRPSSPPRLSAPTLPQQSAAGGLPRLGTAACPCAALTTSTSINGKSPSPIAGRGGRPEQPPHLGHAEQTKVTRFHCLALLAAASSSCQLSPPHSFRARAT